MWIPSSEVLQNVYLHCNEVYPEEACGLIFTDETFHRATNIQNKLHAHDPEIYPRNARNGYTMSVADIKLLDSSFKGSNSVKIIYHSHPDVGAYFSNEDSDKALFMGALIYQVCYLVVDTKKGRSVGAKLFSYFADKFECVAEFDGEGLYKVGRS